MIHELIRNATRPVYILLKQIFQSSKGNSDKNVDLNCEQLDYYEHACCNNVNCEHMDYYEHVCCKNVHCEHIDYYEHVP